VKAGLKIWFATFFFEASGHNKLSPKLLRENPRSLARKPNDRLKRTRPDYHRVWQRYESSVRQRRWVLPGARVHDQSSLGKAVAPSGALISIVDTIAMEYSESVVSAVVWLLARLEGSLGKSFVTVVGDARLKEKTLQTKSEARLHISP